jgi:hypothetical protein
MVAVLVLEEDLLAMEQTAVQVAEQDMLGTLALGLSEVLEFLVKEKMGEMEDLQAEVALAAEAVAGVPTQVVQMLALLAQLEAQV